MNQKLGKRRKRELAALNPPEEEVVVREMDGDYSGPPVFYTPEMTEDMIEQARAMGLLKHRQFVDKENSE